MRGTGYSKDRNCIFRKEGNRKNEVSDKFTIMRDYKQERQKRIHVSTSPVFI